MVCGRHHNFMHRDRSAATSKHFVSDRPGASAESPRSLAQCQGMRQIFTQAKRAVAKEIVLQLSLTQSTLPCWTETGAHQRCRDTPLEVQMLKQQGEPRLCRCYTE